MTNWASNSYRIEGKQEDLQQIYDLFVKFDKGRSKPFDEQTSFGLWEVKQRIIISVVSSRLVRFQRDFYASRQKRHGEPQTSAISLKSIIKT